MANSDMRQTEIDRIKAEYERRRKEIPKDFYSLEHSGNLFIYLDRVRKVIEALKRELFSPLAGKEILEIGYGTGDWIVDFARWGAESKKLHGVELDEVRAQKAQKRIPSADLRVGEASKLPWPDNYFDLVLQSTVFTSILNDSFKRAIAKEMLRVLKPEGFILWYDFRFNNPNNPNVRGIEMNEIRSLFPDCHFQFQKITLAPPIARWLAPYSWLACYLLEKISFLRTHYLVVIKKT